MNMIFFVGAKIINTRGILANEKNMYALFLLGAPRICLVVVVVVVVVDFLLKAIT